MSDLATLRTAKEALDEGLISVADFDTVKEGFLKAQQIKAGLDAGFIKEEDFEQARDAFFQSLNMGVATRSQGYSAQRRASSLRQGGNGGVSQPHKTAGRAPSPGPASPSPFGNKGGGHPPPPPSATPGAPAAPAIRDSPQRAKSMTEPKQIVTSGKTSLSGISVDENAVQEYTYMKARKTYLWMTFKINNEGTTVILADTGGPDSSFEDFVAVLPENECRYGVFDCHYEANENRSFDKLVFFNWAPDYATVKQKMMMASTKDFFKGFLEGIQIEMQVTDYEEVTEQEMHDAIKSSLTRK